MNQAEIVGNSGNSYIGIVEVPAIRDVRIVENKLLSNVKPDRPLIYVNAGMGRKVSRVENVRIENNVIAGSVLLAASEGGSGNVIKNNQSLNMGLIKSSCDVRVGENTGFVRSHFPLGIRRQLIRRYFGF